MAQNLHVDPAVLQRLANKLQTAGQHAADGAGAVSGLGSDAWLTHGVVSAPSNSGFSTIEESRKAAADALSAACGRLYANLNAAKAAYEGVDKELQEGLGKQMLDK